MVPDFLIVQNKIIAPLKKNFVMVFAFHKLKHYLLKIKFLFYVYQIALVYLVNKP
jgi:hypothetical protein